jgi:hypothetical protein
VKRNWLLPPVALMMTACAQGCAMTKALYDAIVHNSGAPPKEERARIAERGAVMLRDLHQRRVVVLPMQVLGQPVRHDTAGARLLVERLRAEGITAVASSDTGLTLPFVPQPNELAIYWIRFKALAAEVSARPRDDADYVILVDILGRPENGRVGAVHVMSVTGRGEMAYASMWNSHQTLYQEFLPRSIDDAAVMVATDIRRKRQVAAGVIP